jgi:uncharacterized protein YndB with AHSA1/START domain
MPTIRREAVYPYPPERVWRALTNPQALAEWLMPNDFQPRKGHKFQFRAKPQPGWRGVVDCEVLEVDAPRRLSYSWQGDADGPVTRVTWTLEPTALGTRLRLEHVGFRGFSGLFHTWILGRGWGKMLRTRLPAVLPRVTEEGFTPAAPGEMQSSCT